MGGRPASRLRSLIKHMNWTRQSLKRNVMLAVAASAIAAGAIVTGATASDAGHRRSSHRHASHRHASAARAARLNLAVASGRITKAAESTLVPTLRQRITARVKRHARPRRPALARRSAPRRAPT